MKGRILTRRRAKWKTTRDHIVKDLSDERKKITKEEINYFIGRVPICIQ